MIENLIKFEYKLGTRFLNSTLKYYSQNMLIYCYCRIAWLLYEYNISI